MTAGTLWKRVVIFNVSSMRLTFKDVSLPKEELHLCNRYQSVGLAVASAASLHSALLFTHNLATCEPSHPWGFSSLPTLHLPLPVFPTHAPKILLFRPQISPLLLGSSDSPWPTFPIKATYFFLLWCHVSLFAPMLLFRQQHLIICLHVSKKRGQVLPTLAFSEVARWMAMVAKQPLQKHVLNKWFRRSIYWGCSFAYHLSKLFQNVHPFQDNTSVSRIWWKD